MKAARIVTGILVFVAMAFSWLFVFPLFNRLRIDHQREQYHPATFEVDGAFQDVDSYWLTGTLDGRAERVVPQLPSKFLPKNADDLLAHFPRGSELDVLYNPLETETIIQGETLRVLHDTPDFWREEDRLRKKLLWFVCLPTPFALTAYLITRWADRRRLNITKSGGLRRHDST